MNKKKAKTKRAPSASLSLRERAGVRAPSALAKESDRALVDQIRRLLALPMNKRTHFLRVRHPGGGSHL
jgi:hypothetical protein